MKAFIAPAALSCAACLRVRAGRISDIAHARRKILPLGNDNLIFDLFEIRASRDEIRRFYRTVGLVEDQAASE